MTGREYHEKREYQKEALRRLRDGERLTTRDWLNIYNSRLPIAVERLRKAHGFSIEGDGSLKEPYWMAERLQYPGLVKVSKEIQEAYYRSNHWKKARVNRLFIDGFKCVQCGKEAEVVHHTSYQRLFQENIELDLISMCNLCHERLHENCRLAFPSGMRPERVKELGIQPQWESWLLPMTAKRSQMLLDIA